MEFSLLQQRDDKSNLSISTNGNNKEMYSSISDLGLVNLLPSMILLTHSNTNYKQGIFYSWSIIVL